MKKYIYSSLQKSSLAHMTPFLSALETQRSASEFRREFFGGQSFYFHENISRAYENPEKGIQFAEWLVLPVHILD